ncbi:ATP-binding protein [Bifidobacterium hapali]|uniref:ATP-binding protein n=2 Tax=Bifidobacterium hapali TaxID=1630172 RepID=A0A261G1T1_9BIFI|nr:ATP-binding protein [Bifidobacterium hapali]
MVTSYDEVGCGDGAVAVGSARELVDGLVSPEERFRTFLFELMERRHDTGSTLFATQYPQKDWHQRLGGGTHADAIMDRIVHNTTWIETGEWNMREHAPGK